MSLGVAMAGVACCPIRRGASISVNSVNSLVLILKDLLSDPLHYKIHLMLNLFRTKSTFACARLRDPGTCISRVF